MCSVLREVFSHLLPPPYVCCCWVVAAFWHPEVQSCPTPSSFAALSLWPPQPRRRWLVSGRRTPNPAVLCPLTSPFTSKALCGSTNVGLGAAHPHFPRQDADSPPPSIGAFSADALPSSVPFAIPRLPLHIPHSLPFLSARIPGITECRTPTRGCRTVQEHRAVPRPTAPCPPPCPHFADRLLPLQVVAAHGHVHHAPRHRRCSQLRCVHLRLLWASELWLLAELYLPVPLQL